MGVRTKGLCGGLETKVERICGEWGCMTVPSETAHCQFFFAAIGVGLFAIGWTFIIVFMLEEPGVAKIFFGFIGFSLVLASVFLAGAGLGLMLIASATFLTWLSWFVLR